MTIDNKAMLDRVIAEVFNGDFVTTRVSSDEAHGTHGVRVSNRYREDRTAIIRAGHVWMDVFIPELNVQTGVLVDDGEEDDDAEDVIEAYREGELRSICRVNARGTSKEEGVLANDEACWAAASSANWSSNQTASSGA